MRIHITIENPQNLKDTFGKPIKGPVKPLIPFESIDGAIKWLKMIEQRSGGKEA